jgi:mitochondrial-processing peptidase subunit beta
MVLAAAGGVNHDQLVEYAEKHFGSLPSIDSNTIISNGNGCRFTGSEMRVRDDDIRLAHVAIAVEGTSWSDADTIPLMVASTMLGSWDRSMGSSGNVGSLLAQLSAKHNLCHSFQAFNTCYADTGLWGMYFVTDKQRIY